MDEKRVYADAEQEDLRGVHVPGRGWRYYPSEVRAKVPIRKEQAA